MNIFPFFLLRKRTPSHLGHSSKLNGSRLVVVSIFHFLLICCLFLSCCSQRNTTKGMDVATISTNSTAKSETPVFNADSAYTFIARQVAFGPRVPNTQAHRECAAYLTSELERHGAILFVQEAILTAYNGEKLNTRNIIGSFDPEKTRRVLLFAHWDSRPYADRDANPANHRKPIDGADDGASGVGVLLEIARQLGSKRPGIGVDIIFFDAEDYGLPEFEDGYEPDSWCLGTQFWIKNQHVPKYRAEYGILLDMVGAKGATFYKEFTSVRYASQYVEKVWGTARNLGYGKFFINKNGGGVTDDHTFINEKLRIPCLDIINQNDTGFGDYWHTLNDTMDNISKETLKAVGQTVLEVLFN